LVELKELEDKMRAVMAQAKECVDMSVDIILKDPSTKPVILKHWENFLFHLLDYVKKKESASGQDIIKGIALTRFFKYIK
jgi:hypothetical protein